MVLVDDFCIDRFEAHLRRDSAAGRAHAHHERPAPDVQYVAVSARGVFPQAYISRDEATAACAAAGKRLCTRREWLRACRGTRGVPDPHDGSRVCNHGKPHLLTKLFGDGRDYEEHYNSPQLNQTPGFLAETGSHEACRSTAGVYDMVGNLHEWVSDAVTSEFLRDFERESVRREFQYVQLGSAIFMGGFYSTRAELGEGCAFTTIAHDRRYHDYSTGFRCCRDETDDQSG